MSDETLIREVEDSLKQERLDTLWREYGFTIIAGIIMAVAVTGGVSAWKSWSLSQNEQKTAALFAALETEKTAAALANLNEEGYDNHAALAGLTAAGMLAQSGKISEARQQYGEVAASDSAAAFLRDLATVMGSKLEWDKDDPGQSRVILSRLEPIWSSQDNPWRFQARLLAAMIHAHSFKDYETARTHVALIASSENDAPQPMQEKAKALYQLYNYYIAQNAGKTDSKTAPQQTQEPEG